MSGDHRVQRRKIVMLWAVVLLGVMLVFSAVLAVVTPRIVNRESIKNAIEASISQELGGTFTYRRVDLSVFPRPRVIIRAPQVRIPGGFSGTLDTLVVYPALFPLLTGKFQLSKVVLDHPVLTLSLPAPGEQNDRTRSGRPSPKATLTAVLEAVAYRMPDVAIVIRHGKISLNERDRQLFVIDDAESRIAFSLAPLRAAGGKRPEETELDDFPALLQKERFRVTGSMKGIVTGVPRLPGPIILSIARFEAVPRSLSLSDARARLLDGSFTVTGTINDYLTTLRQGDLDLSGSLGPGMVRWVGSLSSFPPRLTVHAPLTLSRARLQWGSGGTVRLNGIAAVPGGAALSFDLSGSSDRLAVKSLRIHDKESDATLTMDLREEALDLSFGGNLARSTLNSVFEYEGFQFGWIRGDFRAKLFFDRPEQSTAEGSLVGEGLVIPFVLKVPVTVDGLVLRAEGRQVALDPAVLSLGKSKIAVQGTLGAREEGLTLDLDLSTDGMEWSDLRELLVSAFAEEEERYALPVLGAIRLRSGYLATERYTYRGIDADIALERDESRITLRRASVCGISLPGTVIVTPQETRLDLRPSAQGWDLGTDLACLTGGRLRITGSYAFVGRITARGPQDRLLDALGGTLALTAQKGRVYHDLVFIRTIAYLNVSDLLRGTYDNIEKDGVPYDSLTARAAIRNGVMTFTEAVLKSPVMNIVVDGTISLPGQTIEVTLLAAPFTTVDAVVKRIPLVGEILGGTLVSIPIRIKGPLDDPDVTTLPVSAIGKGLFGMMKRTLRLPFTIIEPIIPKGKPDPGRPGP